MPTYYPNPNFRPSPSALKRRRYKPLTAAQKKAKVAAFRKKRNVRKYKPSASFTRQMTKYNNVNSEKKIMSMNNYLNSGSSGYLQDIDAVPLPNAGIDTKALTCVVLQTGRQYTDTNLDISNCVSLMDGYSNVNGTLPNRLIGQYAKITSSYMNICITMNPANINNDGDALLDATCPHQFRLIQVKARRDKMVNPALQVANVGVPSLATNLFRNEEGLARGINSECATQDVFTWFINKQFWTVLKDERFTLATPIASYNTGEYPLALGTGVSQHKSQRFKKYWLPKPSNKVIFRSNTVDGVAKNEIIDYNYVVHTIILCKNTSSGERPSDHWSVQANGATAFIDE